MLRSIASLVLIGGLVIFTLPACAQKPKTQVTAKEFDADPAKAEYTILDVRTPSEWKSGHLKDAVHIDWYADDFQGQVMKLDKNKRVLVYCASGGRSAEAQEAMQGFGFTQVVDLKGGITDWKSNGLPVVK